MAPEPLAIHTHTLSVIYASKQKFVIIFSTGNLRSGPVVDIFSTACGHPNSLILFDNLAVGSVGRLNT